MGYSTYRGIEIARNSMSDALEQMERLRFAKQNDEVAEYDDEEDEDGTPPNEYEMRALRGFIGACVDAIELYLEAVNNGYIEDVAKIDLTALKDAIETFESEED